MAEQLLLDSKTPGTQLSTLFTTPHCFPSALTPMLLEGREHHLLTLHTRTAQEMITSPPCLTLLVFVSHLVQGFYSSKHKDKKYYFVQSSVSSKSKQKLSSQSLLHIWVRMVTVTPSAHVRTCAHTHTPL